MKSYGHHMMKSGLGRITENTPQYQGVIVYNMADYIYLALNLFLYGYHMMKSGLGKIT